MSNQIAMTTLTQMGGTGRLSAMIGAKDFVVDGQTVQFKFAAGSAKVGNTCRITLDASDTYTVEFWYCRGLKFVKLAEVAMVYCDSLRRVFEEQTKLRLSL